MGAIVRFEPSGVEWEAKYATTVLDAARRAGVFIRTRCNGKAGCLLCKVQIAKQEGEVVEAPTLAEQRKLGVTDVLGLRLACQARIIGKHGAATIVIPEDPLKAFIQRKLKEEAGASACGEDGRPACL